MYLTGRARWAAIVVFAAVTAAGAVRLNPSAAAAAAGAVVAVGAAALLLLGWRPVLLYAALATAGIAVLGNGTSSNIGWFAVCLLAGWCVLAGTRREGLAYWAGAMLLFASEWLWGQPDPGLGRLAGRHHPDRRVQPADPARPGPAAAASAGPGGPGRAGQGSGAEPDRPGAA